MRTGPRTALRLLTSVLATGVTAAALATPSAAGPAPAAAKAAPPSSIALPDGFQPEGIAIAGSTGYFGSRADGDIYAADLRTGKGEVISQGPGVGSPSVGLKVGPRGRLYVSGGTTGTARIVSVRTGRVLSTLRLSRTVSFVNDVVITPRAAFFTDSAAPQLYRVPIFRDGRVAKTRHVRTIRLRGDWEQPAGFGANGLTVAPSGRALLVVNSEDGTLFRVPRTGRRAGVAERIRLRGASLTNGDGMLLEDRTLYVVRNQDNEVVELALNATGDRGRRVGSFTSPRFDVPTTIARWRNAFYLPNARFSTPPTPATTYDVTRVVDRD